MYFICISLCHGTREINDINRMLAFIRPFFHVIVTTCTSVFLKT